MQGAVTPISAILMAATGVTICDRLNLAVTLWPHLKIMHDPVTVTIELLSWDYAVSPVLAATSGTDATYTDTNIYLALRDPQLSGPSYTTI